jgi:hypothetical protein
MRALVLIGDAFGGVLIALAVPIVILAVGAPVALAIRFALSTLGLL